MFHSVIGTRNIENTTMRLRGSFSPSKYAMKRERKSGFESCNVRSAATNQHCPPLPPLHGKHTISVLCQQIVYEAQHGISFALLLVLSERTRVPEESSIMSKLIVEMTRKHTHVSMISCTRPPSHFPRSSSASKAFAQEPMPSPSSVRERTKSQRRFPAWSQCSAGN